MRIQAVSRFKVNYQGCASLRRTVPLVFDRSLLEILGLCGVGRHVDLYSVCGGEGRERGGGVEGEAKRKTSKGSEVAKYIRRKSETSAGADVRRVNRFSCLPHGVPD